MRVEFDSDGRLATDNLSSASEQVTLAIVVAIGHHRTVKAKQDDVDRECGPKLIEDLVA
jgi:hypothetical protein